MAFLVGGLALLGTSCGDGERGEKKRADKASLALLFAERYPDWSPSAKSDEELWRKDRNPILHGIVRKQYGDLDGFIERLDERYRCGRSLRHIFYDAFANYRRRNSESEAFRWHPVYEEGFKEWAMLKPESPCPTIGLACLYTDRAWLYRGGGWASEVTEDGWKGFRENLDLAHDTLNEAPEFVREDPHYYKALMRVGLGKELPFETVNEYFKAGQDLDPLYLQLYFEMAEFLRPRWYGNDPDDWHQWLELALKHEALSDEDRLVIYGATVRRQVRINYGDYRDPAEAFDVMGIEKPKFMKGLAAYVRRYPDSSEWPIHYLYHAHKAGDVAAMKEAVELSGNRFDPKDWKPEELLVFFEKVVSEYPEMAESFGRNG